MDFVTELLTAAKASGVFAALFLLYVTYIVNEERKLERKRYEELVSRFLDLATDTTTTLKDWGEVLTKARHERD